jgi:hypothetical protein
MKATRCTICETRPQDPEVKRETGHPYCRPCLTEAEYENTHGDYDHEGIGAGTVEFGQTTHKTKSAFNAWLKDVKKDMEQCWVCHPELNEAQAEYKQRTGTSRQGIVLNVPLRASGKEKAAHVSERFGKPYTTTTATRKGVVIFKAVNGNSGCEIRWDLMGHLVIAEVTVGDKTRKARNVSEVLRLLSL